MLPLYCDALRDKTRSRRLRNFHMLLGGSHRVKLERISGGLADIYIQAVERFLKNFGGAWLAVLFIQMGAIGYLISLRAAGENGSQTISASISKRRGEPQRDQGSLGAQWSAAMTE